MTRTHGACAIGAIAVSLMSGPVAAQSLTVGVYGGEWGEAIQSCIIAPFTKATGIAVTPDPGVSNVTLGKLRQQKSAPTLDLAWLDGGISELADADGLIDALDPAKIKNLAGIVPQGLYKRADGSVFAASTGFYSLGLVYNTKEVKTPPASFADLWKPEFANAVTLPSPSNAMGAPLFMHLNKALGGAVGAWDPAISKYRELKVSNYFDTSGAATNSFQSGEVIAGAHYASAAWSLADKGLPITYVAPKEGAPSGDIRLHLIKGAPRKADAEKFVDFAIGKDPASCMVEKLYVGPATKDITLSDKAKSRLPWGPTGSVGNLALINWPELNAQRQAVIDVWNKDVVRK